VGREAAEATAPHSVPGASGGSSGAGAAQLESAAHAANSVDWWVYLRAKRVFWRRVRAAERTSGVRFSALLGDVDGAGEAPSGLPALPRLGAAAPLSPSVPAEPWRASEPVGERQLRIRRDIATSHH